VHRQGVLPLAPRGGDIGAPLFVSVYGFFDGEAYEKQSP
jgi:hypothetical protein